MRYWLLIYSKGHLKEEVLAKLTENNISSVIILGGFTSKIHVKSMDICLNKSFKTYLRTWNLGGVYGESGKM